MLWGEVNKSACGGDALGQAFMVGRCSCPEGPGAANWSRYIWRKSKLAQGKMKSPLQTSTVAMHLLLVLATSSNARSPSQPLDP